MNYMAKVAEMLGVELGEVFKIPLGSLGVKDKIYRITEDGVEVQSYLNEETWLDCPEFPLVRVLTHGWQCVPVPWKPKIGEVVWAACIQQLFGEFMRPKPKSSVWTGDAVCHVLNEHGLIYQTEEECDEHMKDDYERVTGEKWRW